MHLFTLFLMRYTFLFKALHRPLSGKIFFKIDKYSQLVCNLLANEFIPSVFLQQQLLYLLGILTDYGKPVMLIGENGCGKSAIVNERIRTVCSGEVAEVLGLTVDTNR